MDVIVGRVCASDRVLEYVYHPDRAVICVIAIHSPFRKLFLEAADASQIEVLFMGMRELGNQSKVII